MLDKSLTLNYDCHVGGTDEAQREGVYRSSVLCCSYLGVGRGSESSNLSWKGASVAFEEYTDGVFLPAFFDFQWPAKKIGEFQAMAMGCDAKHWEICFVNSMSRYLIVGGGGHKRRGVLDNSVFPHTKHVYAASTIVTNYLQETMDPSSPFGLLEKFHPVVFSRLDSNVTSTSIRRGCIKGNEKTP